MQVPLDLLRLDAAAHPAGMPPGLVARRGPAAPAPRAAVPDPADPCGPRLGELLVALSHALDLAEGQPAGHAVRTCWIGQQLGHAIGLDAPARRDLYYAALLMDAGGSSEAPRLHALFLADDLAFKRERRSSGASLARLALRHGGIGAGLARRGRLLLGAVQHADEIARELAQLRGSNGAGIACHLGLGEGVADAIQGLDEHWDGGGQPQGLAGAEIPLGARVTALARAVDVLHADAGPQATRERVARHAGRRFDPRLAQAFAVLARDPAFWRQLARDDLEAQVVGLAPTLQSSPADDDMLDLVAMAFGQVADAKSLWTAGHSARVAQLAERISLQLDLGDPVRRWLRRGALLHDLGKLGVGNHVLDRPARIDPHEWAVVHRHAQHTERLLERVPSFGALARIAGAHHEALDGSGYPRGLDARHIRLETRVITAADRFDALTSARPWRPALSGQDALATMRAGLDVAIDGDCLAALERALEIQRALKTPGCCEATIVPAFGSRNIACTGPSSGNT